MPAKSKQHVFQPPKGTRDFYPDDMAVRRHIERVWRTVSTNHGFDEIDGPMFEHLDLYTVKSGEGIVSELFSFERAGGDTTYALRPEFTPTLARLYASRAAQLPKPTRWFCIANMFRAERPQRGRLREHIQWNADIIGDDSPAADADAIAVAIDILRCVGLESTDVTVRLSHRALVTDLLHAINIHVDDTEAALQLLDKRAKLKPEVFAEQAAAISLDITNFDHRADQLAAQVNDAVAAIQQGRPAPDVPETADLIPLLHALHARDVLTWCAFDLGIVRGLAYYTGAVFEIHETTGQERAIAGGGRYDHLIELFGGPPTPAVGFAMGDVVLKLVLEDKGLLQPESEYHPRPDAFIISSGTDLADQTMTALTAELRRAGLHVRHSYKQTRNVGKLLGEAGKARAHHAVILGEELADGQVTIKNLDTGDQTTIPLTDITTHLQTTSP